MITLDMIADKQFTESPNGYNQTEVDDFLDAIIDTLAALESEKNELQQQLATATARAAAAEAKPAAPVKVAAPAATSSADVQEILEMAQRMKNELLAKAEDKAATIVEEAEAKAKEQLAGLADQKAALEAELAGLKSSTKDFAEKLAEMLEFQQEVLENAKKLF